MHLISNNSNNSHKQNILKYNPENDHKAEKEIVIDHILKYNPENDHKAEKEIVIDHILKYNPENDHKAEKEIVIDEKIKNKIQKVIEYSDLSKNLKIKINTFLDVNSLNAMCNTEEKQTEWVRSARILLIKEGKSPKELGFKTFELFKKYIKAHQEEDHLIKLALVNSLNKGEPLELSEIQTYREIFSSEANEEYRKKITRFDSEKICKFLTKEPLPFPVPVRETSFLLLPNIERLDLTGCLIVKEINSPEKVLNDDAFENLLKSVPQLTSLSLDQYSINTQCSWRLGNFQQLKVLEIKGNALDSLSFLESLDNLKVLTLNGYEKNIEKDLYLPTSLEEIHFKNMELSDLSTLKRHPNLKVITIENCQNINNLDVIGTLKDLQEVNLIKCGKFDLNFLGELKHLKKLSLIDCGNDEDEQMQHIDLNFLNELHNLEDLEVALTTNNLVIFLDKVTPLKEMQFLKLKNCIIHIMPNEEIQKFAIRKLAPNVRYLDLTGCRKIDKYKFHFEGLDKLETLILDKSKIDDLSFTKELKKLKTLHFNQCDVIGLLRISKEVEFLQLEGTNLKHGIKLI